MFDGLVLSALDKLDSLAPEDQRRVEYACEQLLDVRREGGDHAIMAKVVKDTCKLHNHNTRELSHA